MNLARSYALAIHDVRKTGKTSDATLIASTKEALRRRGLAKLLPRIIEEYARIEQEKDAVTVRATSDYEANKGIDKLREFGITEYPRIVFDKTLVKGYVLEGKDFRYDASAKRALVELYKRLTA